MNVSAHFVVNKNYRNVHNEHPVYLRIIINRRKTDLATGVSVKELRKFDERNQTVRGDLLSQVKLDDIMNRAKEIIAKNISAGKELSIELFRKEFTRRESTESFYSFAEKEIIEMSREIGPAYFNQLKSIISKMKKFRKEVYWNEFNHVLIKSYIHYMRVDLKNRQNTIAKNLLRLQMICKRAVKKGNIECDPFEGIKIKKEESSKVFLTLEEVKKLRDMYSSGELPPSLSNVLKYFLFSCYTGLRYQDVHDLEYKDIMTENGKICIRLRMKKTKKTIMIPVTSYPLELLDRDQTEGNVFRVNTNQVTNSFLKEIAKRAGIEKKVSFHTARHTFGTLTLNFGAGIYTVKELMGHTDIKTTEIYAKLLGEMKIKEMEYWEGKLN